jgi:hypothetical protein
LKGLDFAFDECVELLKVLGQVGGDVEVHAHRDCALVTGTEQTKVGMTTYRTSSCLCVWSACLVVTCVPDRCLGRE